MVCTGQMVLSCWQVNMMANVLYLKDGKEKKLALALFFMEDDEKGSLQNWWAYLPSSGKTQVCLLAAVSVASVTRSGVVYIDTGNSFSACRVAKLVSRDTTTTKDPQRTIGHVMSSISCYHVFDVFTLFDVLDQIESKLKFQVQKNQDSIKLLIVDSMSSLITPVLGGSGPNGHAIMISLGYHLKKLAIEYNLSVLVTNHMVGGEGGHSKPALGESWKTVPHVRILLSRDKESNICNMSLLRHPSMAVGVAAVNIYED